jgi:hypothetical protein
MVNSSREENGRLKKGVVLNPKGRNQYDAARERLAKIREEIGLSLSDHPDYPNMTNEAALEAAMWRRAIDGDSAFAKLLKDRTEPAVTKHEVDLPGADAAALADRLSGHADRKRSNGADRSDDSAGEAGAG